MFAIAVCFVRAIPPRPMLPEVPLHKSAMPRHARCRSRRRFDPCALAIAKLGAWLALSARCLIRRWEVGRRVELGNGRTGGIRNHNVSKANDRTCWDCRAVFLQIRPCAMSWDPFFNTQSRESEDSDEEPHGFIAGRCPTATRLPSMTLQPPWLPELHSSLAPSRAHARKGRVSRRLLLCVSQNSGGDSK
jgi:hypothetical protein